VSIFNLAELYKSMGKEEEAQSLQREILGILGHQEEEG